MLGVIATLKVKDGAAENFIKDFKALQAKVLANEPGCKLYALHQASDDPNTFVVMERYDDEAAFAAHGKTAHFAEAAPAFACLAGRPELQIMQEL